MTIISETPTQGQISLNLPSDIPAPKFQLFQRVSFGKVHLTITGVEYCEPMRSLLEGLSSCGWSYRVSRVYGKSIESMIQKRLNSDNCTEEYWEDDLVQAIAQEVRP